MKTVLYLVVGLALFGTGAYLQFAAEAVSGADQARCEQLVRDRSGDDQAALEALLPKCTDPGMIAMMDAQAAGADAQTAASNIANANNRDLSATMINYLLIGLGIGLLAGAAMTLRKRA